MLFSKKRAKRFFAILLAAMLVFANESVLTAVALTTAEEELEQREAQEAPLEDIQEESEEELQEESEEELQEESEEEFQEESEEELQEESEEELQEESEEELQEEFQEESEEELQEESEEELQEEFQEESEEELQEEFKEELREENPKGKLLGEDLILFNAGALSMGMGGLMLTSVANPEDYESFWGTETNPIVVEVAACYYDRGESDFPVTIGSATGDNIIDGGDRIKARVSGSSVTLSWSSENVPSQVCIEGDPDWDIRDIPEGQTSVTIEFESGRDFYYIEVKYGNDFDNFGPTEECPTVVCLWTNFDRRDGDAFPVSVADVTEENVIDGWDMLKARVAGTSVTLTWTAETRPTQICIDLGEGNWDIRDVVEDATSENIDISGNDFWYIEVKYGNGGQGGGDNHNIGVDFLNDLSALPGDDTAQLYLDIVGRQSDDGIIYLDRDASRWEFGKGSDGEHLFDLSVPDNAACLGFRLSTAGKTVKEAHYSIGEDIYYELTLEDIAALTSDSYFNIRVNDGESWVELIVFSIVLEEGNQPGGGGGNDYDVTYSENTRISEDLTKFDITVGNNVTLTIDNCKVQINHKLTVKSGANVVGTSADSVLEIAGRGISEGITLYRTNGDILTIGTSFGNDLDEPIDFRWNTSLNRWETEQNPFSGYDLPWYTISYGNSANLTTENGQVYAIRVHVGDITYSSISSEYNASETDKIYSMEDTIFHQKTQEEENDPEYQDTLMRFGIGGSDGDIFFKSDLSGASIDFKFIPDFGYQLENIFTNENNGMLDEFAAAETISTFTFNVVQGKNVHFEVKFVEANNTVTGNAGISSQATIDSSNAASSGALEMTVDTAIPNSNIPQGSEALAAYDITLKNVVSKGEGRGNWETALTDLGSNSATVTLPVSDTTNYTYTVIREHDGQSETLEATITDGGISFETNKFSTYTIVKKPVAASIATATVTLGDALTYNGTAQTQTVSSVKLGEVTLNASTDYEITNASETDAGTYTLTVTGKGDYKETVTKQFTIAKKELTPSIAGTVTKAYDGNKEVNDASSLSVSLAGKCGSDDVSATVAKYEYNSADVGTGKTITATGIALSGTKAVNYELTSTTATATVGEVTKVTPEITLTGLQETTLSPVGVKGVLTPPDENANVIVEYKVIKTESVSGEDPEYEWTTTRPVAPGTYDVRATLPEATANLNAVTTPVTGTYKLTQYVAPAPDENNNETESAETETKEETIEVETKTSAGNAVTAEPDIIEAEPLVSAEEPLIVPAENIEAEMPEGISEEAKEELVEQVAETVSELVEAILGGDEAVENAVSEETLENIKTALDEGKTIIAVVKVEVVDESSISSEDKASIEKVLESQEENNIEIACYLDLSIMLKTTDGEELGTYNELTGKVSFTIEAPKDMTCSEGQEYVVIRIHNGESTIIPVTVNPDGTLTFETDRFSSYALALRDVLKEAESVSLLTETKLSESSTESAYTKSEITEVADTKLHYWVYAIIALGVLLIAAGYIFGIKKVKSE